MDRLLDLSEILDKSPLPEQAEGAIQRVSRKQLIEMLEMVETHLHSIKQLSHDAIITTNRDGEIISWNDKAERLFGYNKNEISGQTLAILLPERHREKHSNTPNTMATADITLCWVCLVVFVGLRKDGSEFPLELSYMRWVSSDHIYFTGILRDLTTRKKTEADLQASELRLRTVVSYAPIVLFAFDKSGIITLSEGRGLLEAGLHPGEAVGRSAFEVFKDIPESIEHFNRALKGETFTCYEAAGKAHYETLYMPLQDKDGQQIGVIGVATNITDRVHADKILNMSERRFRAMTEQASDLFLMLDSVGIYRYVSPSHQRILGYAPEDLINTNIFDLVHPADLPQALSNFAAALTSTEKLVRTECRLRHANGSWLTVEWIGHNLLNDPDIGGLIVNARDITERNEMEGLFKYQAQHDSLTDLPNRTLLQQKHQTHPTHAQYAESSFALLLLGLDHLKDVVNTFGHQHGDQFIQHVGACLTKAIHASDTVARLSNDEFAILLPIADEESAQQMAQMLQTTLKEPFMMNEIALPIDVTIGAVVFPDHGTDALTLLRRADVAMNSARQTHDSFALYNTSYDQDNARRLALIGALRHAIDADELVLYYQPKVEIKTGAILSVEALIRWQHPTFGFISPDQFIPLAEQTGLIIPLTHWVVETQTPNTPNTLEAGYELNIAVNISMWDLREPALPELIGKLLERYEVPARLLRIELTESAVMTDLERTLDILICVGCVWVVFSIDDFGTGYSSLAYLKRLPVSELKIDRSFIQNVANIEIDTTIVRSTITMAHSLGLKVVAEGVEDKMTMDLLSILHCDTAQGFYLSRPLPAHNLEKWLLEKQEAITL